MVVVAVAEIPIDTEATGHPEQQKKQSAPSETFIRSSVCTQLALRLNAAKHRMAQTRPTSNLLSNCLARNWNAIIKLNKICGNIFVTFIAML
jgi:hypothetical protein